MTIRRSSGSAVNDDLLRARPRHADHDELVLLVLGEDEVSVIRFPVEELGPAGIAGAALAGAWHGMARRPQGFQNGDADRHFDDAAGASEADPERLVLGARPRRLVEGFEM